ncbi:hypothetical protein DO021_18925 [Desulfobacter hydrogenophilus]|uniref:Uncharacterized protein n=1 Tax=Desulfobacter hydrogenophilus TaxID=2291 RepID=A0A328F7U9_9BACT|nr:hypothetical protein [Desulfobacter hydrogenophilus]NDY73841.1 hypothetical protein [Desulfobacter hydrogenophilus]QBH13148.1 hypothetical protein EYB58_09595 [Desulfobacter hydrogenophilus]RAM00459.1 hypothetical protein DO021_18925 [Desulfobacter hydrogenophilus]
MYTRNQALALAKQLRTCPPLQVKNDPQYSKEIKRHLDICPFCATELKNEKEAFEQLSSSLGAKIPLDQENPAICPGQVRALTPGIACWRNDFFYSPPEVVVLKEETNSTGTVLVAQTWQDLALAGPGDLVLPEKMYKGGLFIETWNVYTLAKEFLGTCFETLDTDVVESVLKMNHSPEYLPQWARKTMPLKEDDPRLYFRQIEMETGYTFASMAAMQLIALAEKTPIPVTLEKMQQQLKEWFTGISWDWIPESKEECMAVLQFPAHALPMTSSEKGVLGKDNKTLTATYFSFNRAGMQEVRPVVCQIIHTDSTSSSFSVSGVIRGLPKDICQDDFQCYIKDASKKILMACNWIWEKDTERFIAIFERPLSSSESLALFIVHYEENPPA